MHFTTRLTHFGDTSVEAGAYKGLFSYNFHHLDAKLEGDNKYTPDMANIHTCTACGKTFGLEYDLRRHENTVHSEYVSSGDEDSASENEKRSDETSESETSANVDLEDNAIYQR